ncbi:hypothetical protein F9L33_07635 [Amylibacter sp. SFDW26]|uniref:hypothetical protein n=1 Tax=Amylibacter sp. SFDW26 TaxID=2652722 RepID=UPI001262366E|nr:hypothetical protein [Amylibacter sp. SFDW26]KAB7614503.1 hypothetical protein F9L33_07635 [Amylibacter sp. SFDW26]
MTKFKLVCATVLALTPTMSFADDFDYYIRVVPNLTEQQMKELQRWAAKSERFGSYAVSTAIPKFDENDVEVPQPGVAAYSTGYKTLYGGQWSSIKACNRARTGSMKRCVVLGSRIPTDPSR